MCLLFIPASAQADQQKTMSSNRSWSIHLRSFKFMQQINQRALKLFALTSRERNQDWINNAKRRENSKSYLEIKSKIHRLMSRHGVSATQLINWPDSPTSSSAILVLQVDTPQQLLIAPYVMKFETTSTLLGFAIAVAALPSNCEPRGTHNITRRAESWNEQAYQERSYISKDFIQERDIISGDDLLDAWHSDCIVHTG